MRVAALLLLAACRPAASTVPGPADVAVYSALVDAGCMSPSDGGPAAVAEEHASTVQPQWLLCLYGGGTVQACDVPCTPPTPRSAP